MCYNIYNIIYDITFIKVCQQPGNIYICFGGGVKRQIWSILAYSKVLTELLDSEPWSIRSLTREPLKRSRDPVKAQSPVPLPDSPLTLPTAHRPVGHEPCGDQRSAGPARLLHEEPGRGGGPRGVPPPPRQGQPLQGPPRDPPAQRGGSHRDPPAQRGGRPRVPVPSPAVWAVTQSHGDLFRT